MQYNISNIVIASILFGLGITIGSSFISFNLLTVDLSKLFELTLGSTAVIIAILALNTWRTQFFHNESFQSAIKLESSFKKFIRSSRDHWSESIALSRDQEREYNRETLPSYAKEVESFIEYHDAWDDMSAYLELNLDEPIIAPQNLRSELIGLLTPIHRDNIQNFDPIISTPDWKYDEIYKNGLERIREFRPKYSDQ